MCVNQVKLHRDLALVAQLDACPTGDQEVPGSTLPGRQHSLVETDHEIFSAIILSLPLIQAVVIFSRKNVHNTG